VVIFDATGMAASGLDQSLRVLPSNGWDFTIAFSEVIVGMVSSELVGEPWYTEPNQQPWRERPSQKQPTRLFRARISSLSRSPLSCAPLGDHTTRSPINTGDSVGAVRRKGCIQTTTPSLK
jgi:hypothetical protein